MEIELVSPLLAVDQSSRNRTRFCVAAGSHCIQYQNQREIQYGSLSDFPGNNSDL